MRNDRWTALLVQAREGRSAAFDELLAEARPAVWKRARQRLQDDALADDVASRTFIKAWRNLSRYDAGRANASTWLYKIAERLIITSGSTTSLLDTLEKAGLVRRTRHPADRRKLLIDITEAGTAVVDALLPSFQLAAPAQQRPAPA